MRKFTIIQFDDAITDSYFQFEKRLPPQHNFIKSVCVFSPDYATRSMEGVDVKLSLMNDNKRDFIGNPVVSLGHYNDKRKDQPIVKIGNFYEHNFFNGYLKVLQNPKGEPITIHLYIETEYRHKEDQNG